MSRLFRNKEYIKLVQQVKKIRCIDPDIVEKRDQLMAQNIEQIEKRVVVILGNIHASKKKIVINNTTITPTGYYLRKKAYSINVTTTSETEDYFDTTIKITT
ncbi:MAG: hypothetical protein ACXIUB_10095 [Wenzhouxiangella sp.]